MDTPVNILLVDDEARNLDVLETILQSPEYRLVRAQTGEEALRALVSASFALLVLDIRMPDMSGIELAQIVKQRKRTRHLPIIFLTAYYREDEHVIQGYGAGAVDYLSKPCNPTILRSKVAVFVDLFRKSRALEAEIGERRQAEERVRHLNEQLSARVAELAVANEDLEAFSYTVSHDLRAPLRAMQSFASLLSEEYSEQVGPQGQGYLQRIVNSAQRLDRLIRDVLNYSKVARGELTLEAVNLEGLVPEILESYPEFQPPAAQITVARPLPVVQGNVAALTQVISNLVGNAVKFVTPGVKPELRIRAELVSSQSKGDAPAREGNRVRLWFEDNGLGIARENHQRIFQMFQRLHREDEFEGTGIGLTIVRKAVERMGGLVGVESTPGQGSRFCVELRQASAQNHKETSTA
jgi:two-component system sensor histidine kinase/response regulator